MDKTVQKQRNDRHNRKLVRSTEHSSWFGDFHAATTTTTTTKTTSGSTVDSHSHKDVKRIGSSEEADDTTTAETAAGTHTPTSTDNKTIRRLEFFTSLQKQLMNSLGRRSSSSSDSGSNNCAIKRNASCRIKTEKRDKFNCQKAAMPSSFSSASLAGVNLSAQQQRQERLSPTQPLPVQNPPSHVTNATLPATSHHLSSNSTDHHQHLSFITESVDQESNNHEPSSNLPIDPNAVEAMFKTCRLSPTTGISANKKSITAVPTNQSNDEDAELVDSVDSALIFSRSVPNTLTLSPTNPFFSSIEQHLINENPVADSGQATITTTSQLQQNKNPFLYDNGTSTTTTTHAVNSSSVSGDSGSASRVNSGDSGGGVIDSNVERNKNKTMCPNNARLQAVTTSSSCSKREEFLKATMKICLVVSPPSNKLQVSFSL